MANKWNEWYKNAVFKTKYLEKELFDEFIYPFTEIPFL
jgi:hypothetical protein